MGFVFFGQSLWMPPLPPPNKQVTSTGKAQSSALPAYSCPETQWQCYLELAYNHADDAAIWCRLVVLRRDAMLNLLEPMARELLLNDSFPLGLRSFPCNACSINVSCA